MKNPKLLYVSCHSILEYDELRLFRDMGITFFSLGAYIKPEAPSDDSRPPLLNCSVLAEAMPAYNDMYRGNREAGVAPELRDRTFTKEFLDHFDVIVMMHVPDIVERNWELLKGRAVIWRTIGQSIPKVEKQLSAFRNGLKIVRYSPQERVIPGYIGEDALIRFGKYKDDFKPWTGELNQVITIGQSMKKRRWWCNYDTFRSATFMLPAKLYGRDSDSEEVMTRGGELTSYDHLLDVISKNAVYLYCGTKPASYTLNFIEACMGGIPMVSIGPNLAAFEDVDYIEAPRLLVKHNAGFVSDDTGELRQLIHKLLKDKSLREETSIRIRQMAVDHFGADSIRKQWDEFFTSL
jgi:hypothetical protein